MNFSLSFTMKISSHSVPKQAVETILSLFYFPVTLTVRNVYVLYSTMWLQRSGGDSANG